MKIMLKNSLFLIKNVIHMKLKTINFLKMKLNTGIIQKMQVKLK